MTPDAQREEAINTRLADLLNESGASARAETIVRTGRHKKFPDLRVEWAGLRIVIEAKYEGSGAAAEVERQVEERLQDALGDVGIALLYPDDLKRKVDVRAALRTARLRAKFSAPGREGQWQTFAGVTDLLRAFEYARALLIDDDAVIAATERLQEAVRIFENAVEAQPGRRDALLAIVSAADVAGAGAKELDKARKAAGPIAGLAVCTAAMLQAELSKVDPAVPPLPNAEPTAVHAALIRSWRRVLEHDYAPIFRVGLEVLEALADDEVMGSALKRATELAETVSKSRLLSRHDLIGRVYHTLLADQKFLATYFTSVPSATMLSYLALAPERWPDVEWAREPEDGPALRVADFASGTGTLLLASFGAVRQNWASARAATGAPIELQAFGKSMIEDGIRGYDVLAYALQVCASTLLLAAGGSVVSRTGLHRMPFGGTMGRLGSLELIAGSTEAQLWGDEAGGDITVEDEVQHEHAVQIGLPEGEIDFVIMNPPFTRSVGGSQLMGSLDGPAFSKARSRLKDLIRRPDVAATLTAGLGAPFVDLGGRAVRPGGRLALVLPKSVLTGDSWSQTREYLAERFHVEFILTSHEAGRWNFSDSTDLSEAMLVARRLHVGEDRTEHATTWIGLRSNPLTAIEALGTLAAIKDAGDVSEHGTPIRTGDVLDEDAGEMFVRPAPQDGKSWRHGTFTRSVLDKAASALLARQPIPAPRTSSPLEVPLKALEDLGTIGYDRRDITDAFELVSTSQGYPAFWGQDAGKMRTLAQSANRQLSPRSLPAPGRQRIKPAGPVWGGAGRLMISERLRAVTYRTTAVVLSERAVANTSWSVNLHGDDPDADHVVALWLNSTLGLLAFITAAEETEGPWIALKKNSLKKLPVLDPERLDENARGVLRQAWQDLRNAELQPVSKLSADPTRNRIDLAICEALGMPEDPIVALRELLGSEPRFAQVEPKRRVLEQLAEVQQPLF